MKIFYLTLSATHALDFVGIDNETNRLERSTSGGGGGGRRNKFSAFYNALSSGSKLDAKAPEKTTTEQPFETTVRPTTVPRTQPNYAFDFGIDPRFLENLDPRALAPIESTFDGDFENFDVDSVAREDPVYQETMGKMTNLTISLNQINNFGRGDFKLTQHEMARKLVADNTFKELDKFTKLMQMIMYLQFEPVFSKYCFYGCWCMPAGGADITKTWGQPVDEIDASCRDMQMCYKCAKLDYGATCKETNGYKFKGYVNGNGDRAIRCTDKKDTCSRALCECDKKLAEDLAILEDTAQMDYRNRGRLIYFENLNVDG